MTILNVAIGLILTYLVFAIVVCGVQEWWAQFFGQRGKFLRIGMQRLIDDDSIFIRILQHPLVGGLYRNRAALGKPPSYVDPANFALALANVLQRRASLTNPPSSVVQPLTFQSLRDAAAQMARQHSPVADSVLPILDQANGDLTAALKGIESWFSGGMDRVSGWYKAFAQRRIFAFGLIVAFLGNIDTIAIYQALNRSPALATQLADSATAVVSNQHIGNVDLSQLQKGELTPAEAQEVLKAALATPLSRLPIGYACLSAGSEAPLASSGTASEAFQSAMTRCRAEVKVRFTKWPASDWLVHVAGWILTALAGTLGAPYWFSMFAKVVNIRGSGPKPEPIAVH